MPPILSPENSRVLTAAILQAKLQGEDTAVEYLASLANKPTELAKVLSPAKKTTKQGGRGGAPFQHNKSFQNYLGKARGQPCKSGEAAERTGCIPAKKPQPKQRPNKQKPQAKPIHLGQQYGVNPVGMDKNDYLDALNDVWFERGDHEKVDWSSLEDRAISEWEIANKKDPFGTIPSTIDKRPKKTPIKPPVAKKPLNPKLKGLAKSPVQKIKPLKNAGVNSSMLLVLENGQKGVFKPGVGEDETELRAGIRRGTYYRREVAAYQIADILGFGDLVPPTTFRKENDNDGSIQEYVDNTATAVDLSKVRRYDGREDAARAALLDYLTGNTDRHLGNWLVDGKGKLILIDNGLSFPTDYVEGADYIYGQISHFWENATNLQLAMPDVTSLQGKWLELLQAMQECGLEQEAIVLAKERYDAVVSGKYKRVMDLPAPDGLGGIMTIADFIDVRNTVKDES